jgi:hypothetical protein
LANREGDVKTHPHPIMQTTKTQRHLNILLRILSR